MYLFFYVLYYIYMKELQKYLIHIPRIVIAALMMYFAVGLILGNEEALMAGTKFDLPFWFMGFVGVLCFCGGLLMLWWRNGKLQEYAHVGFLIYFAGAYFAHVSIGDPISVRIPALLFFSLTFFSLYMLHIRLAKRD